MPFSKSTTALRTFHPEPVLVERVAMWLTRRGELTPMLAALSADLPAGKYRQELRRLTRQLEEGATAEDLCRSRETVTTLLPLLAVDQSPADSGRHLNRILSQSFGEDERRRQRRRMLAYPLGVLLLAVTVLVFLCVLVVPVFAEMFNDFGMQTPAATQAVVALSALIRCQPFFLVLAIVGVISVVGIAWYLVQSSLVVSSWLGLFTKGSSAAVSTMAVFIRRLSEGLSAALPLPTAVRLAGETTPSIRLRRAAKQLADELTADAHPVSQLSAARRFPATMVQLLDAPQTPSSNIAHRLGLFSDTLAERVASRFDWSTGIVAQFSVFAVGAMVAFVLLALLLPLVSLINGLT